MNDRQVDGIAEALRRFRASMFAAVSAYRAHPGGDAFEVMNCELDALIDVLGDDVVEVLGVSRG